jgi:hypothetical protein
MGQRTKQNCMHIYNFYCRTLQYISLIELLAYKGYIGIIDGLLRALHTMVVFGFFILLQFYCIIVSLLDKTHGIIR